MEILERKRTQFAKIPSTSRKAWHVDATFWSLETSSDSKTIRCCLQQKAWWNVYVKMPNSKRESYPPEKEQKRNVKDHDQDGRDEPNPKWPLASQAFTDSRDKPKKADQPSCLLFSLIIDVVYVLGVGNWYMILKHGLFNWICWMGDSDFCFSLSPEEQENHSTESVCRMYRILCVWKKSLYRQLWVHGKSTLSRGYETIPLRLFIKQMTNKRTNLPVIRDTNPPR